jgi:hypothetical protein
MVWRTSLSIAGKQSGLHFIQRAGVRLRASVWHGGAAGLRPIRPERMRTRVGMLRRPAKNQGRRAAAGTGPSSSPRPESGARSVRRLASAKPTKRGGSVARPRIHCPPIRTAVPTPSRGSPECKAPAARVKSVMEAAIREAVTAEAAAVKAAAMKATAAMKAAAAPVRGGGTSRAGDRDCQSRRGQHTEN